MIIPSPQYFLDPATTVVNGDGSRDRPFKTFDQAKEVLALLKTAPASVDAVTLSILGDVTGDVNLVCDWEAIGPIFLTIDGSLAQVAGTTAVIASVTPANPSTPVEWRISITGFDFSTRVGQYAEVTSGANAGMGFVVLKDLGSGAALITEPHAALSYGTDAGTLSALDPITFFTFPKFGDTLIVSGSGDFGMQKVHAGNGTGHDVQFQNMGVVFLDTCMFSTFDLTFSGEVEFLGCYSAGAMRASNGAVIMAAQGGTLGSPIVHKGGSIHFTDFTIVGNFIRSGNSPGSYTIEAGWLAISYVTTAVNFTLPCDMFVSPLAGTDTRLFGTNVTGPKVSASAGCRIFYDASKPMHITGTGADVRLAGTDYAFSQLPALAPQELAGIVPV